MASKSPVSAVSQEQRVSSTPEVAPAPIPTSPQPVSFPSPQTFDFIPQLHALLLRLLSSTTGSSATANQSANAGPSGDGSQSQQQQKHHQQEKQSQQQQSQQKPSISSSTVPSTQTLHLPPTTAESFTSNANSLPPLEAKDLSTASSAIKIRIQKARGVVENLPDVERTIDEQTEEIGELLERIACLKAVIADFGRRAAVTEGNDKMDESV